MPSGWMPGSKTLLVHFLPWQTPSRSQIFPLKCSSSVVEGSPEAISHGIHFLQIVGEIASFQDCRFTACAIVGKSTLLALTDYFEMLSKREALSRFRKYLSHRSFVAKGK